MLHRQPVLRPDRAHSSKTVLIRFRDGEYFEEWIIRFNRGNKMLKPVKFFAHERWRSSNSMRLVPFSATRFDAGSEKDAMRHFVADVGKFGGEVLEITQRWRKLILESFDHEIAL